MTCTTCPGHHPQPIGRDRVFEIERPEPPLKNTVFRRNTEKSQFMIIAENEKNRVFFAVNGKNRDITHTATNSCLCLLPTLVDGCFGSRLDRI